MAREKRGGSAAPGLSAARRRADLGSEIVDRVLQTLIQRDAWSDAQYLFHPADVGDPTRNVLVACAVDGLGRDERDRRRRPGYSNDPFRQRPDRHFDAIADVAHTADGLRQETRGDGRRGRVGLICEAAGLAPVPDDGERLAGERLTDEDRHDSTGANPVEARPVDVEVP